jgi:hypothetical protein
MNTPPPPPAKTRQDLTTMAMAKAVAKMTGKTSYYKDKTKRPKRQYGDRAGMPIPDRDKEDRLTDGQTDKTLDF